MFNRPEASNVQVTQQFTTPQQGSFALTVSGTATISTMFWRLIGQENVNITASGEVVWGIKKLNLALAFDNTGSMASNGKMTALKEAAHNLLDHAQEGREDAGRHPDLDRAVRGRRQCRHRQRRCVMDRLERLGGQERHLQQVLVQLEKQLHLEQRDLDAEAITVTWNGCVKDRDQNNDVMNTRHRLRQPGHHVSRAPGLRMSDVDDDAVHRLDRAQRQGRRDDADRQHQRHHRPADGVADAVANHAPFNAPAPLPDLDKVIILMTDGDNTQNRWSSSQSSIDARTEKACTNAKAANIKLYTVRVINGNADAAQELRDQAGHVFRRATGRSAQQRVSAIAQNLANLRIAK